MANWERLGKAADFRAASKTSERQNSPKVSLRRAASRELSWQSCLGGQGMEERAGHSPWGEAAGTLEAVMGLGLDLLS